MICLAKAFPVGDIPKPNDALQVELLYMSFHAEDRVRYLKSGWRLVDNNLESIAEYFENILNSHVAKGSLTKKREK